MKSRDFVKMTAVGVLAVAAMGAQAAQLSSDAKAAIPKDVHQLIVVDYRAIQNSPSAMALKEKMLQPDLKRLEQLLISSGLKVDQDVDVLALAAYEVPKGPANTTASGNRVIGVAQGQFHTGAIMAQFTKNKVKPLMVRNNAIYPLGNAGASVVFLDQTTMIFGDRDAVRNAIDARDGQISNFLNNGDMINEMGSVDRKQMWSLLDQNATEMILKSMLGSDASQLVEFDTVRNRVKSSRYTMDFGNGVKFDLAMVMSDTMTAATASTLLKGVSIMRKTGGSPMEKSALDQTAIDSNSGTLTVSYAASDSQFTNLLNSALFQSVVK